MRRLLLAALLLAPAPLRAQDNAVYDPEPPSGSALVRFVNALSVPAGIRPGFLPALRLGTGGEDRAAPYRVVEAVRGRPLAVEADAGQASAIARAALDAPPDGFLTVLLHAGPDGAPRLSSVVEAMNFNRARARLGFLNGLSGCEEAALRLDAGGGAVFEGLAPGEGRQRTVNPVRAPVRALCADGRAAPLMLEGLEPGAAFTVILAAGSDGAPVAALVRDRTVPWRR